MKFSLTLLILTFSTILPAQKTTIIVENMYRYVIGPEGKLTGKKIAFEQKAFDMQHRCRWQFFYDDSIPSILKGNIAFFYDSLKLITREIHGRDNVLERIDRYAYNKDGKLSEIKSYDIKNNQPVMISHMVYSGYEDTVPTSILTYNAKGKWIAKTSIGFEGNTKIKKTVYRKGYNNKNLKEEIYTYVMDGNVTVSEKIFRKYADKHSPISEQVKYDYGNDSLRLHPIKKIFTDENNKLIQTKAYTYTRDRQLESEKTYDADGRLINYIIIERAWKQVTFQKKNEMFPINP